MTRNENILISEIVRLLRLMDEKKLREIYFFVLHRQ